MRGRTDLEEIDYSYLMDCLKNYSSPRAKITRLLKEGDLIRVKKGIYIFGPKYRKAAYSLEVLANKIYGPSYVSLEYALGYYGMIPEYVVEITSVTSKRKKQYNTPVGRFTYFHLPTQLYSVGYTLVEFNQHRSFLIATPEKALADLFYLKKYTAGNLDELEGLLFGHLRLDYHSILNLRVTVLNDIAKSGGSSLLFLLIDLLRQKK